MLLRPNRVCGKRFAQLAHLSHVCAGRVRGQSPDMSLAALPLWDMAFPTRSAPPARLASERMAAIDQLIAELERSYEEAQERMSDPAVYNDRKEAAETGRRLKELEGAHRLAQEWRQAQADLEAARDDAELASLAGDLESGVAPPQEGAQT